ncbi:DUF397 domain-containing protein [Plantactinospora sp. B6F1]|uniref:DUF397 domain-containing protein n=1 Tax=Plantactinospora sp. B6F1 TaxID=3158971 RepID=UPI0032D91F16
MLARLDDDSSWRTTCPAGRVLVRDSKDRDGARLSLGPAAWRAFVGLAKRG